MNDLKKTMLAVSCLVLSVVPVTAQTGTAKGNGAPVAAMSRVSVSDVRRTAAVARPTGPSATRVIVVSLEDRRLALVEDGVVTKVYRVAVGQAAAQVRRGPSRLWRAWRTPPITTRAW